jgi:hypothetical protein
MRICIFEIDRGGYYKPILATLYSGVTCTIPRHSEDDLVDIGTMYKNNFGWEYDYRQDMGNAYVYWHKVH